MEKATVLDMILLLRQCPLSADCLEIHTISKSGKNTICVLFNLTVYCKCEICPAREMLICHNRMHYSPKTIITICAEVCMTKCVCV